ncbi:MAG: translation initiation factor IF-3 [Dehalococcoidia bacterium]|nr:translation initiation factor IF-3 [Dehalococcoidia bacterium]
MAEEVRVIGESGEQLGVMSLADARQMARERDLDLVEVAPTAQPPVCRLLDFGKFKYEQAKKERQSHKSQKSTGLREVKLRPKIGQHDIDFKVRTVKRLLEEGDKVKILVIFRGREIVHPHLGKDLVEGVIKSLGEAAKVERGIGMEGRTMTVILSPGKPKKRGQGCRNSKPVNR